VRFATAVDKVRPYVPGQSLEMVMERFGLSEVVKLASNEFPLPPFAEVKRAIRDALDDLNRYPDGDTAGLRAALADRFGRAAEEVVVTNGSCELLLLLGEVMLDKGDEVVFADPGFLLYEGLCSRREATAVRVSLHVFRHNLEAIAAAVTPRTKMVIVCNPHNPTGTHVPVAGIAGLVAAVPDDVMVVIDEAYNEFVTTADAEEAPALQAAHANVVVLRTFSKIYGLCGLRVGYGLCAPEVKAAIDRVRQPFNVNRLAQIAAQEALKHQDQVAERRAGNARLRDFMVAELAERGRATVPSQANFMLVDIRGLRLPQQEICGALLAMGMIVRDGNALGCPGWARVSVGTQSEIEFFLRKIASLEVEAQSDGRGRSS
jgi:histidinol-phosphate aminotransferase